MLSQPSNCIPSTIVGNGLDVIDASIPNKFTCTIDGTSTVGSYQLVIKENTPIATTVYDTGVVTLDTPFSGHDYNGRINIFEVTVPSNADPANAMVNEFADGYKWQLTIWETYDSEDAALTRVIGNENGFYTKIISSLGIDPDTAPSVVPSRRNLWKAIYRSTSTVMFFSWQLAERNGTKYNIIYDTGDIYQSARVWFQYNGLINGKDYGVRCSVTNQYGVSKTTPWKDFTATYTTITVSGATSVTQDGDGLRIDWSGISFIQGEAKHIADDTPSTNYEILDDYPRAGEKTADIGAETYLNFESSDTFTLATDDAGEQVFCGILKEYEGDELPIMAWEAEDSSHARMLKHEGFTPGLRVPFIPSQSASAIPSRGTGGHFTYVIDGDEYTADTELPMSHIYRVEMKADGLDVYADIRSGIYG